MCWLLHRKHDGQRFPEVHFKEGDRVMRQGMERHGSFKGTVPSQCGNWQTVQWTLWSHHHHMLTNV